MTDNKYNILHVIDKFSMDGVNPSSCAYLIRDWHRYANKDHFNVMACGLKAEEPAGEIYRKSGIPVFFLGNGKYSPGNVTGLMRLIDWEKIDLLHLHGYSSANFGRIAAKLKKIPNIVHEHAILKILPHQYIADLLLKGLTDCGVAVSGAVKDFMVSGRHVPRKKIKVVYNGVNLHKFVKSDPESVANLRHELGLLPDHFIIGNLTRLREEKGNAVLIEAMKSIVAKHPMVRLVIAGDGPEKQELETLVHNLELDEYVKLVGFRRDIMELLTLFDLMAIPSLNEGFGLVLVEALAMELPSVCSHVGGLVEIAGEPPCAQLVPAGDSDLLAQGILELIEKPNMARRMAQRGLIESQKFSIENNVTRLEEIYLSLLEKKDY